MKKIWKLFDLVCSILTMMVLEGLAISFIGFAFIGDFGWFGRIMFVLASVIINVVIYFYIVNWIINVKRKS